MLDLKHFDVEEKRLQMTRLEKSAVEVFEGLLSNMPLETLVKTCVGCPETSRNIETTIRQVSEL